MKRGKKRRPAKYFGGVHKLATGSTQIMVVMVTLEDLGRRYTYL